VGTDRPSVTPPSETDPSSLRAEGLCA
jgi:hypothetical protein